MVYKRIVTISLTCFMNAVTAGSAINNPNLYLNASVGFISGEAKKFVYDTSTSQKISQLNWKMNTVPLLKMEGNLPLTDVLNLNAQGWISFTKGNGLLDDYDWTNPYSSHWTHWSHHPDTEFNRSYEVDINFRAWFLKRDKFRAGAMLGFQRSLFHYSANGGCYNYPNQNGCFPADLKVIDYQQIFNAPYLGLMGNYTHNLIEISGIFKYSNLVNGEDHDEHCLRSLSFHEESNDFSFYQVTLNAGYYLKPQMKLFAEGTYSYIPTTKTQTAISDAQDPIVAHFPKGSSGLGNNNYVLSVGIQYHGVA